MEPVRFARSAAPPRTPGWRGRAPALAVALLLLVPPAPAAAIVRRHDRDDSAYRALAADPHAACVVGGIADGTLVDPRWVLTAAHVAAGASPFRWTVRFGAIEVPYDTVVVHPDARQDAADPVDLALLHLTRPLTRVAPAPLDDGADEVGRVVLLLGTGRSGDGRDGPRVADRAWRGARNRITEQTPRHMRFVFDTPPGGEDLEGISGPGDSGGPAFLERDGRLVLAGVSSRNDSPHGEPPCTYGTIETYARVAPARGWIDAVMHDDERGRGFAWTRARSIAAAGWPAGPVARLAREWLAAVNARDPDRLEAFVKAHGDSAMRTRRTPEARRAGFLETWRTWGRHRPVAVAERRDGTLAVLVEAEHDGLWLDYRFAPSPDEPGRLSLLGSIDLNAPGEPFAWPAPGGAPP